MPVELERAHPLQVGRNFLHAKPLGREAHGLHLSDVVQQAVGALVHAKTADPNEPAFVVIIISDESVSLANHLVRKHELFDLGINLM